MSQEVPEHIWTYHLFNTNEQYDYPFVKVNSENDIIFASKFQGTLDFDDGPDTQLLKGSFFITKLNQNKETKWIKILSGINTNYNGGIYVDYEDNIYVCGSFYWSVDFDPGPGVFNLTNVSGGAKGFLLKLDKDGNFVFAVKLGEGNGRESNAQSVAVDQDLNIQILGYYHGEIDFNSGGAGGRINSNGESDIFLLSLDKNGIFQWVTSIGNKQYDYGFSLVVDHENNIYITGNYYYDTDFDSGPDEYILKGHGSSDGYVAKFNNKGILLWAKSTGCGGHDDGQALVVDKDKNVYLGGLFLSNCNFDPEGGSAYFANRGSFDIFVIKYAENGDFLWARTVGGVDSDYLTAMTLDQAQNIIFVARTNTIVLFETTFIELIIQSHQKSILLAKYDQNGNYLSASSIGSTDNIYSYSLDIDQNGNLFIAGNFKGSADFDPSLGIQDPTQASESDLFLIKLKLCDEEYKNINVSSAFPYKSLSGKEFIKTGVYIDTIITNSGCREISTINFTKVEISQTLKTLKIGPNPFSDDLAIYLPEPLPGLSITLYSIDGKLIKKHTLGLELFHSFETEFLVPSSYIVEIEYEGLSENRLFVKI
ncbi:MAG TPA: SBBP repeat-containing protein [Saprospiraceae bacterium]|nr:SBBP repeat-containing protein [Saprospiraceae bacterium]